MISMVTSLVPGLLATTLGTGAVSGVGVAFFSTLTGAAGGCYLVSCLAVAGVADLGASFLAKDAAGCAGSALPFSTWAFYLARVLESLFA